MSMDQDWLDQRLASENYLPDDGFTARVVAQLPQKRKAALPVRGWILGGSGLLAFCLFVLQVFPLIRSLAAFSPTARITIAPAQLESFLQQPALLLGAMVCAILLTVGALSVLRRLA